MTMMKNDHFCCRDGLIRALSHVRCPAFEFLTKKKLHELTSSFQSLCSALNYVLVESSCNWRRPFGKREQGRPQVGVAKSQHLGQSPDHRRAGVLSILTLDPCHGLGGQRFIHAIISLSPPNVQKHPTNPPNAENTHDFKIPCRHLKMPQRDCAPSPHLNFLRRCH
jgi:hypothetical protein